MTKREAKKRAYSISYDLLYMLVRSSDFLEDADLKGADREKLLAAIREVLEELKVKGTPHPKGESQ